MSPRETPMEIADILHEFERVTGKFARAAVEAAVTLEEASDHAVDGLVPYRLTARGESIAGAFAKCVDNSFSTFGLGDHVKPRDVLRGWGKDLCFSSIAKQKRFRGPISIIGAYSRCLEG